MATVRMQDSIARKKTGGELSTAEIEAFVNSAIDPATPREQIGAMLMAIYIRGMSTRETIDLTRALIDSGEVLSWPEYPGLVVDKHSTGGVGDKVSLPLAPALAACGVKVPMISGRGLGHTGGTLDKLEAIPGFRVQQSPDEIRSLLTRVGCCIVGQTAKLVPGDRILYAIRDITSTVESLPLITASIVSKKVAEGLSALILDVKVGRAAFMKTYEQAYDLARSMVDAGKGAGVKTLAVMTRMDTPIGLMIGNALEIAESIDCLKGRGPADLEELVCVQGGQLLFTNGSVASANEGVAAIKRVLHDGSALRVFRDMVSAQGAGPDVASQLCGEDPWSVLPKAKYQTPVTAAVAGFLTDIDAMALAEVSGRMGAGRLTTESAIDYTVGLQLAVVVGDKIAVGQKLLTVHHTLPLSPKDVATLQAAFVVAPVLPDSIPVSRIIEFLN